MSRREKTRIRTKRIRRIRRGTKKTRRRGNKTWLIHVYREAGAELIIW